NIQYTINASYTGTAEITLTDTFPPNTQLVNATGIHTKTDTTAVWKLSENEATGTAPKVYIFTFILGPNKEDMLVKNKIVANATGGTGSGIPPTADNCGGLYTLANPLGNFGDPTCDFKKDDLYTLLKQQDPANADKWFFKIVPCESSYNPNTWRDPNILPQTPDPAGAWGLFQMGRGRNGQYDHGDVYWKDQATSAVEWNKLIGGSFGYWACK
ncbi:MAG: hypothetical protein KBD46_03830, partial [Candidatus Levybacteria bacterium]|nr:hypothetical protein [Candidatus Levybacteria bacterium]